MKALAKRRPVKLRAKAAPAPPTDDAFDLKLDAFGWAVKAHEEAVERFRQARNRYTAHPCCEPGVWTEETEEWERWVGFVQDLMEAARENLILAVIIAARLADDRSECKKLRNTWGPASFEYRGTIYVVSQESEWLVDFKPVLTIVPPEGQNADWMDGDGPGGEA